MGVPLLFHFGYVITLYVILLQSLTPVHAATDVQLVTRIARGYDKQASETGRPYSVYYGIPFAEPPVGDLRYSPPRPYLSRGSGSIITSTRFRASCYQFPVMPTAIMSEDWLHLNIFSPPSASPANLKKVMVWIHGGGFMNGAAEQYIPSRMVTDGDVIVVTIQYRLAGFGFLSSGDDALPGNLGLKDQLQALRWIKGSIRLFGGDPDDITIFGESAGSASAILQSGTMLSAWAVARDPQKAYYEFAKRADCLPLIYNPWNTLAYHQNILNCLKSKTAQELVNAHPQYELSTIELDKGFWEQAYLGVVVDKDFLPKMPAELMADRAYLQQNGVLDRSYMIGMTDNEGILAISGLPPQLYGNVTSGSNMANLIRSIIRGKFNLAVDPEALNVVDFIYTYPRDSDGKIPLQKFLELQTDDSFTVPTVQFARALQEASPSTPVYMYLFDAEPKLKNPDGQIRGTNHGMDLFHEFDLFLDGGFEMLYFYADMDPVKYPIIASAFRGYVTGFAKTGSPAPGSLSAWPRYDRQREQYLAISSTPEVRQRLFAQRVSLWTDFLPKAVGSSWFGRSRGRVAFRG